MHNRCDILINISSSVKRTAKKLSPEAKRGYDKAIEGLATGNLTGTWKGHRAVDIRGMG
ncbi:hypothetical protein [Romboutsia lituseburensis]|uniref:hypothetical protein n=1 Tax=Romboutsia lituseburensis TaxID=1537 RepID=UPI00215A9DB7|nr:hypothetical protein [Romboutsia lituseburensis]MCR8747171.1 hypothetical protein [Romboutsia lituseburensis]